MPEKDSESPTHITLLPLVPPSTTKLVKTGLALKGNLLFILSLMDQIKVTFVILAILVQRVLNE